MLENSCGVAAVRDAIIKSLDMNTRNLLIRTKLRHTAERQLRSAAQSGRDWSQQSPVYSKYRGYSEH